MHVASCDSVLYHVISADTWSCVCHVLVPKVVRQPCLVLLDSSSICHRKWRVFASISQSYSGQAGAWPATGMRAFPLALSQSHIPRSSSASTGWLRCCIAVDCAITLLLSCLCTRPNLLLHVCHIYGLAQTAKYMPYCYKCVCLSTGACRTPKPHTMQIKLTCFVLL